MGIQKLDTQQAFNAKVNELTSAAGDNSKWIRDDMSCSTKTGRFWRVLGTLLRVIGIDVFGHVRVNKVATQMLEFAKQNKDYLDAENTGKLLGVMTKLDQVTHKKYHKTVDTMKLAIQGLVPGHGIDEVVINTIPKTNGAPPPPPPPPQAFEDFLNKQRGQWKKTKPGTTSKPADDTQSSTPKIQKKKVTGGKVPFGLDELKKRQAEREKRLAQNPIKDPAQQKKSEKETQTFDFRSQLKKTDSKFSVSGANANTCEAKKNASTNPDTSKLTDEQLAKLQKRTKKINQ